MAIPKFVEVRGEEWIETCRDANLWRRHVKMLRAKHPPHIVEQLLEAVERTAAASSPSSKED